MHLVFCKKDAFGYFEIFLSNNYSFLINFIWQNKSENFPELNKIFKILVQLPVISHYVDGAGLPVTVGISTSARLAELFNNNTINNAIYAEKDTHLLVASDVITGIVFTGEDLVSVPFKFNLTYATVSSSHVLHCTSFVVIVVAVVFSWTRLYKWLSWISSKHDGKHFHTFQKVTIKAI